MGRTYRNNERLKLERTFRSSPFLIEKEEMLTPPQEIFTCAEHGTISSTGLCCKGMKPVQLQPLYAALEKVGIFLEFVSEHSLLSHLLLSTPQEEKLKRLTGVSWKEGEDISLYELAVKM